jgi:integrase
MQSRWPKYCHVFRDRQGRRRCYFRRPGYPRVRLPLPHEPEFWPAYHAALNGTAIAPGADRARPGSLDALAASYYQSAGFLGLSDSTKRTYRGIIERLRADHGDKPLAGLRPEHIRAMLNARAATPHTANNLLNIIRVVLAHAVDSGLREDNPAVHVKPLPTRSTGFHSWSEAEIARFEARWAVDTRERLALLLYTGQRRSDAVRTEPQHVRDGVLTIRQQKTGSLVEIPVHDELAAVIEASAPRHLAFLVTAQGEPFTANGFGNWFRQAVRASGVPKGCAAHGLRKAARRRLAEAGCTPHEIMSISGHRNLRAVTGYTEAANRAGLARSAIARFRTSREQRLSNSEENLTKTPKK